MNQINITTMIMALKELVECMDFLAMNIEIQGASNRLINVADIVASLSSDIDELVADTYRSQTKIDTTNKDVNIAQDPSASNLN